MGKEPFAAGEWVWSWRAKQWVLVESWSDAEHFFSRDGGHYVVSECVADPTFPPKPKNYTKRRAQIQATSGGEGWHDVTYRIPHDAYNLECTYFSATECGR